MKARSTPWGVGKVFFFCWPPQIPAPLVTLVDILLFFCSNFSTHACPLLTAKSAVEAVREVYCKEMLKYFHPSWLELKYCLGEKLLMPRFTF